jgi:hypothetical protein
MAKCFNLFKGQGKQKNMLHNFKIFSKLSIDNFTNNEKKSKFLEVCYSVKHNFQIGQTTRFCVD